MKILCKACGDTLEPQTIYMTRDKYHNEPWGDIACPCGHIHCTFDTNDAEGVYQLVKVADLPTRETK